LGHTESAIQFRASMSDLYRVIGKHDLSNHFSETYEFALDVLVGLSDTRKRIPSKHLYDARGSELFQQITRLPEYYLTNCEIEILRNQTGTIGEYIKGGSINLVELGAGYSEKTLCVVEYLLGHDFDFQYVPIDISEAAMADLVKALSEKYPRLQINGLVADYTSGLKWLNNRNGRKNFVLFLGSSIGNFSHAEARTFLRNVWSCLQDGDQCLVGFDLKKDIEMFLWAYNDREGVTSEFNLNVLKRINRELGGEFDVSKFRHYGTYDVFSGAMQSYLVSLEAQEVFVKDIGRSFQFRSWEPIHMEYSYKYLIADIDMLASERYFVDSIWRVNKPRADV
jgi:L-histidine N-alpha-methyltransferase